MPESGQQTVRMWRVKILTTTWLSYAGFYFCRKDFSIAKSSLMSSMEIGRSDVAHIFTAYLAAYMIGQYLTGILGRRYAMRILLLSGMAKGHQLQASSPLIMCQQLQRYKTISPICFGFLSGP